MKRKRPPQETKQQFHKFTASGNDKAMAALKRALRRRGVKSGETTGCS